MGVWAGAQQWGTDTGGFHYAWRAEQMIHWQDRMGRERHPGEPQDQGGSSLGGRLWVFHVPWLTQKSSHTGDLTQRNLLSSLEQCHRVHGRGDFKVQDPWRSLPAPPSSWGALACDPITPSLSAHGPPHPLCVSPKDTWCGTWDHTGNGLISRPFNCICSVK